MATTKKTSRATQDVVAHNGQNLILPTELFHASVEAIRPDDLDIKVYVLKVTPENAEVWLKGPHKNRSIHTAALAKLKHALEAELWQLNGEPLIFDDAGDLIDGQHRCLACLQTAIPFWSLVVHGINKQWFDTMGQGSKRSVGDILSILGKSNSRTLGAALRWVWRYQHGQMLNAHPTITEYEVAALEQTYPTLQFSVPYGSKCHGQAAPALITALHFLCRDKEEALAEYFFSRLADGAMLPEGSPLLFLRRYLTPARSSARARVVVRDERKAPVIIQAWNLLRKDETKIGNIQRILWQGRAGQKYPTIL